MNSVMNIDVPKLQTNDVAFGYNSFYWVYTLQTSSSIERLSHRQILRDWKRLSRRDTGLLIISCRVFVMKMKSIYGLQMTHFRLGSFFFTTDYRLSEVGQVDLNYGCKCWIVCFGLVVFVLPCSFSLLSSIPEVFPFHNPIKWQQQE